jgi:hypothetical protein
MAVAAMMHLEDKNCCSDELRGDSVATKSRVLLAGLLHALQGSKQQGQVVKVAVQGRQPTH